MKEMTSDSTLIMLSRYLITLPPVVLGIGLDLNAFVYYIPF